MKHSVYILRYVTQKCPIYYYYRYYGFTFLTVELLCTDRICKYICARAITFAMFRRLYDRIPSLLCAL